MNENDSNEKTEENSLKRAFLEVNNAEKYKNFMLKPLKTKKLKSSDTLDKVKAFLPDLKLSNEKLLESFNNNPDDVNIENVDEEEQFIEMNLAFVPESSGDDTSDEEDNDESEADSEISEEESEENKNQKTSLNEFLDNFEVPPSTSAIKLETTKKPKNKPTISVIHNKNVTDDEDSQ